MKMTFDSSTSMTFCILYMTYYIPYVDLHIPCVSLGLHYIQIITKDKLHMRQWLYETKPIIGQVLSNWKIIWFLMELIGDVCVPCFELHRDDSYPNRQVCCILYFHLHLLYQYDIRARLYIIPQPLEIHVNFDWCDGIL